MSEARVSTIYALCEPDSGEIRYVGKTVSSLGTRLSQHLCAARKGKRTHLHCWLRSLANRPTIVTLELVPYADDAEAEKRVIADLRSRGARLTNATDGGEGKKGCYHSEETRARIRAWNVGRKMPPKSPETLQRMADAQRGKKYAPEVNKKKGRPGSSNPFFGRQHDESTRKRMSESHLKTPPPWARERAVKQA